MMTIGIMIQLALDLGFMIWIFRANKVVKPMQRIQKVQHELRKAA